MKANHKIKCCEIFSSLSLQDMGKSIKLARPYIHGFICDLCAPYLLHTHKKGDGVIRKHRGECSIEKPSRGLRSWKGLLSSSFNYHHVKFQKALLLKRVLCAKALPHKACSAVLVIVWFFFIKWVKWVQSEFYSMDLIMVPMGPLHALDTWANDMFERRELCPSCTAESQATAKARCRLVGMSCLARSSCH